MKLLALVNSEYHFCHLMLDFNPKSVFRYGLRNQNDTCLTHFLKRKIVYELIEKEETYTALF